MAVYVDDMNAKFGRMIMCHMIADSTEELLAMADKIGVARRWIQKPGEPGEHFDVCKAARWKAVAAGAVEITQRRLWMKIAERRWATTTSCADGHRFLKWRGHNSPDPPRERCIRCGAFRDEQTGN